MNRLVRLALASIALGLAGCSNGKPAAGTDVPAPSYATFGEPTNKADAPVVRAADVLARPEAYDGQYLRVQGEVSQVCAKKGCWLKLGTGGGDGEGVFVKFTCPIDGRLIPAAAVGKDAVVEGTVKVIQMSEASARHYKEDAGASPEEIARIVGPQKRITIAAPAARVAGLQTN